LQKKKNFQCTMTVALTDVCKKGLVAGNWNGRKKSLIVTFYGHFTISFFTRLVSTFFHKTF
jgi:hypothetical protein